MAAGRSVALKLDWAHVISSLGLRGQTAAALQAFKKRNEDARRRVQLLSEQPQKVDFAHYRSILKNQTVVQEIEKQVNAFKPNVYDVGKQIKAIETFEAQAITNAQETKGKVDMELKDLEKTLKNIEEARPFEDLTVEEVIAARPDIEEKANKIISKGRWSVPGYKVFISSTKLFTEFANFRKEKFGDLSII
ncbi:ATP synthase D chain, partial [Erysiphe pulchra]